MGWLVWLQVVSLDPRKRLPEYELSRKKEGWVVVGYPTAGYDALRGVGVGLAASIAYNGSREDSLFAYQPYKYYWFFQGGLFQRESRYARFFWDVPRIGKQPYRVSLRIEYRNENSGQFWDIGRPSFHRKLPSASIQQYDRQLSQAVLSSDGEWETNVMRHQFQINRLQVWAAGEKVSYGGTVRLILGSRWLSEAIASLQGRYYSVPNPVGQTVKARQRPTLLDSAVASPSPFPLIQLGQSNRLFVGGAVVWDLRDFEINPTAGWIVELGHETAIPFSTHKSHLSLRHYHRLYGSPSSKFLLHGAAHFLIAGTYGKRIFFTDLYYYSQWADFRSINLLSGPSSLRAYRENRFTAFFPYMLQYELRSRIAEVRFWRQHFVGGPILFAEIASGSDRFLSDWYGKWIWSAGIGGRMLWNMTTVLRGDLAWGEEGWQLHITTAHAF